MFQQTYKLFSNETFNFFKNAISWFKSLTILFNSFNEKSNRVSLPCGNPWAHVKYVYLRAKPRTKPRVEILSERTFLFLFRLLPASYGFLIHHMFSRKNEFRFCPNFAAHPLDFCFQNANRCCDDGLENSWKYDICLTLFNVVSSSLNTWNRTLCVRRKYYINILWIEYLGIGIWKQAGNTQHESKNALSEIISAFFTATYTSTSSSKQSVIQLTTLWQNVSRDFKPTKLLFCFQDGKV